MKVFVLIVLWDGDGESGVHQSGAFSTEQKATQALADHCRKVRRDEETWLDDEELMPTTDDEVIEAYFDDNDFERYSVREYEIDQLEFPLEETDPLGEKGQPPADGINRIMEAARQFAAKKKAAV